MYDVTMRTMLLQTKVFEIQHIGNTKFIVFPNVNKTALQSSSRELNEPLTSLGLNGNPYPERDPVRESSSKILSTARVKL